MPLLRQKQKKELTEDDIEVIFDDTEVRYYDIYAENENDYKTVYNENEAHLKFKLVILNNDENLFYGEVCLSFLAAGRCDSLKWKGCLFGRPSAVFKKCVSKKSAAEKYSDKYSNNKFYNFLYDNLLTKEKWKTESKNEQSFIRLYFYLTNLCAAIKRHYGKECDYYAESTVGNTKYIIFDSRLIDKYGNKIFLIHKVSENKNDISFTEPVYVSNTECLNSYGFDAHILERINPVMLYENPSELIFQGNIEDFDLDDTHHLKHIIDERRERLPGELAEKSSAQIYMYLKSSVEYAVKMSKLDYKFIVPSYSIANNEVQFLIPFYVDLGKKKPVCAIVTTKENDRFVLKTILPVETAYNNARLLFIPDTGWLA